MTALVDTLFITGCGGDIALSIARFVREDGLARRLVGAELRADHPGYAFFDEVVALPRADAPDYADALSAAVAAAGATMVVPMSEAELARLLADGAIADDGRGTIGGARLITANRTALATGLDKKRTHDTLRDAGLAVPRSGVIGEDAPPPAPFIVKPRKGQGSKGLTLVEDWNRDHILATRPGELWQQWLPDADQEFTCGLLRLPGTGLRTINLRRRLAGGLTGTAEVVDDPAIDAVLARVADALELDGAINVQLRLLDGVPMIFEINPRFSSTVGFRHRMGFRDFQWVLEAMAGHPVSPWRPVPAGTRMYRIGGELVRPPEA